MKIVDHMSTVDIAISQIGTKFYLIKICKEDQVSKEWNEII